MNAIPMSFSVEVMSKRLKELRMTQKEFAQRLGVSPQHVSQIMRQKSMPSHAILLSAEQLLRLPPGTLARHAENTRKAIPSLKTMPGIEVEYLNIAMQALRVAWEGLRAQTPADALRKAQGKSDTRFFDAACEQAIIRTLRDFNDHSAIFTEEQSFPRGREFAKHISFFIDPFDRSTPFLKSLAEASKRAFPTVADAMAQEQSMTGLAAPFGSISCLRDGQISFNAMMDYQSGEIYVACSAMIKHGPISKCGDPELLACYGDDIRFSPRPGLQFTCFLGSKDSDKRPQYAKHLEVLKFQDGRQPPPDLEEPGGPARILYLSDACDTGDLACVLSNGEKISEWFGWLAYVRHSDDLAAFELHADQVTPVRDKKILLAPPPNYSIFQIDDDGICKLNLDRLLILDTPVFYRAAILIAHRSSLNIINEMSALDSRRLSFKQS